MGSASFFSFRKSAQGFVHNVEVALIQGAWFIQLHFLGSPVRPDGFLVAPGLPVRCERQHVMVGFRHAEKGFRGIRHGLAVAERGQFGA